MKRTCYMLTGLLLVYCLAVGFVDDQAEALTFYYGNEFSGATSPSGSDPWLMAMFENISDNTVRLTMAATNLESTEFVSEWLFNLEYSLDPTKLTFDFVSGSAGEAWSINTGSNAFEAGGSGNYDIQFVYPPPPGNGDKFTGGETAVYDIGYADMEMEVTFSVSSFNVLSTGGGNGTYESAAKVQGIDGGCPVDEPKCEGSGWIAVPEMQSIYLLGIATVGLIISRRKMTY